MFLNGRQQNFQNLILAIEAIGYDPRDIFVCRPSFGSWIKKSTELTYTTVYAINAIKAGGYTADTFKRYRT